MVPSHCRSVRGPAADAGSGPRAQPAQAPGTAGSGPGHSRLRPPGTAGSGPGHSRLRPPGTAGLGSGAEPTTGSSMSGTMTNWAGNVTFRAERMHRPASTEELQLLVARSSRVRARGTRHSFSPLADTTGDLVSVAGLPPLIEMDAARTAVTVSAGLRYGEIAGPLKAAGRRPRHPA